MTMIYFDDCIKLEYLVENTFHSNYLLFRFFIDKLVMKYF